MTTLVVHLGAHRTGTSTLQKFLEKNQQLLFEHGVQTAFPPHTREISPNLLNSKLPKFLISEENILGTMENNLWNGSLYPDAIKQLNRYDSLLSKADVVYLSIRNYVDYWMSIIAFVAKSGKALPTQAMIEKIVQDDRGWFDIVEDIRKKASKAEIVVREFDWKTDNPKRQLIKVTHWKEFQSTDAIKAVHNARPSVQKIADALLKQSEAGVIQQAALVDPFEPFSQEQIRLLDDRYREDVLGITKAKHFRFLGSGADVEKTIQNHSKEASMINRKSASESQICFLHIGKTGGTYIKSLIGDSQVSNPQLFVGKHGDTLLSTAASYGWDRKLAFLIRDPAERFVSGFNSRMRQGRPTYNVNWSVAEAVSYSFFVNPTQLAEALYSEDERLYSAARFAFSSIVHLKLNYSHYLYSVEFLERELSRGTILVCCETDEINKHQNRILDKLGIKPSSNETITRHEAQIPIRSL